MGARPHTITIYLPNGDPAGIRVAEIATRTVKLIDIPRLLLNDFLDMNESRQVGVYFLIGPIGAGKTDCHIGRSSSLGESLRTHASPEEDWTHALVSVSLTDAWSPEHNEYMKLQSIRIASASEKYSVSSDDKEYTITASPQVEADCQEYLETISILATTLGHPILSIPSRRGRRGRYTDSHTAEARTTLAISPPLSISKPTTLFLKSRGCDASALPTSNGITILAGSIGRVEHFHYAPAGLIKRRSEIVSRGIAEVRDDKLVFLSDYDCATPSMAGEVLIGANTNGRTAWRDAEGNTYAFLEENNRLH